MLSENLGMESASVKVRHMISPLHSAFPVKYSMNPFHMRAIGTRLLRFRLVLRSKKRDFQDFQNYAKPTYLLPASEVQICTSSTLDQIIDCFDMESSESLYKIKVKTSGSYGSGLTDLNSGVLLCLIDGNGYSVLKRIPACLAETQSMRSEDNATSEVLHFQRGCVDEFIFKGPILEKIAAVWISLESGQWRLGHFSLTVVCNLGSPSAETEKKNIQWIGCQYGFELEDILLGEGSDISMTELRPRSFTTFFPDDDYACLSVNESEPSSLGNYSPSSQESMKEYADLKFSLLFYDAVLVLGGSSVSSSAGENAAFAFLAGGIGGFVYLLLLQRSVDGLRAPELVSFNSTSIWNQVFGKFKDSATSRLVLLLFAIAIISAKYASGDAARVLTPKELVFGMIGFLVCKISVLLAAFKPIPTSPRQNK